MSMTTTTEGVARLAMLVEQVLRLCTMEEALVPLTPAERRERLRTEYALDPNAHAYGPAREPLLHAMARAGLFGGLRAMRRETGADPEALNAQGQTAMALALMRCVEKPSLLRYVDRVDEVAEALQVRMEEAPATVAAFALYCVARPGGVYQLMEMVGSVAVYVAQVPGLLHRFVDHPMAESRLGEAQMLLDWAGQSVWERDAHGRAVVQRTDLPPALYRMLRDAMEPPEERHLAVLMARHRRLGANASPLLTLLPMELLRDHILPLDESPTRCVRLVRRERLRALARTEHIEIDPRLQHMYVHGGADIPLSDFRRSHVVMEVVTHLDQYRASLPIWAQTPNNRFLALAVLKRLEGLRFDEPYTPAYAALAHAAVRTALPPPAEDQPPPLPPTRRAIERAF
jgi:hypothetical protein